MEHDVVACAFVSLALCDSSSHFLIGIVRVGDRDPERGREAHGQESTLTCSGLLWSWDQPVPANMVIRVLGLSAVSDGTRTMAQVTTLRNKYSMRGPSSYDHMTV